MSDLVLHIFRQVQGLRGPKELSVTQISAIRFISAANSFSRTLTGLSDHLGITRSATSQLIKLLVSRGYVVREQSLRDKRSSILCATTKGLKVIKGDQRSRLQKVALDLSDEDQDALRRGLSALSERFSLREGGQRAPGICASCHFLSPRSRRLRNGTYEHIKHCLFFQSPIAEEELSLLCSYFQRRPEEASRMTSPSLEALEEEK